MTLIERSGNKFEDKIKMLSKSENLFTSFDFNHNFALEK